MDKYKKYFQIAVIAVAAVWIFCAVFIICAKIKQNQPGASLTDIPQITTQAVLETFTTSDATTQSTTREEKTEASSSQPLVSIDGNNVTAAVSASTPQWKLDEEKEQTTKAEKISVPSEKKEIINAYVNAVNKLKSTADFSLVKKEKLNISIDEVTGVTGVSGIIKNTIQTIIENNTHDEPQNYTFSAGRTADGKTPGEVIAPIGMQASLSASDVVSATAKATSKTSYKIKINLGKQKQTLNSAAPGYSTTMEVFDLERLALGSKISITSMDINYGNSTIEAVIDKDGRITSMKHYLEVTEGSGTGKITFASATVRMHGDMTNSYKITY